jgi:CheY-like chemotaxis protein
VTAILVVDDDISIREVVAAVLQYHGYSAVTASNGKEAITYLEKGDLPDLILSDMMMPVMNGQELCRALLADRVYRSIPVVLMSAAFGARDMDAPGFAAFLTKPFDAKELLSTISRVLAKRTLK